MNEEDVVLELMSLDVDSRVEYLSGILGNFGFETKLYERNKKKSIVAQRERGHKSLTFLGHLDTVSGGPKPSLKDGILIGRGSVDALSPVVAATFASKDFNENYTLRIVTTSDEEVSGEDGAGYLTKCGIISDNVVILEPTNGIPATAQKGRCDLVVNYVADGGHASEKRLNPYDLEARTHLKLLYLDYAHPLLGGATIQKTKMEGTNVSSNVIPKEITSWYDVRTVPGMSEMEFKKYIERKISVPYGYSVDVRILYWCDPVDFGKNNLARLASNITGKEISNAKFMTDARYIGGKNVVILGCGDPRFAHSTDEKLPLEDLKKMTSIYKKIISSFG